MKKKETSILVTGGCGLIGSNFIKSILHKNYNITVIDNLSSGYLDNLKKISVANNKKFITASNWKPKFSKISKMIRSYYQ